MEKSMASQDIAAALERVESILRNQPEAGRGDDAPATARWQGGLRVQTAHANGTAVVTDMPPQFGGTGDQVSPGWLVRAGAASCIASRIAMSAASEGIELTELEVVARSLSDARGIFGMSDAAGAPICAGPLNVRLHVRIAARGTAPEQLQSLVERCHRCSPVSAALTDPIPVELHIDARSI